MQDSDSSMATNQHYPLNNLEIKFQIPARQRCMTSVKYSMNRCNFFRRGFRMDDEQTSNQSWQYPLLRFSIGNVQCTLCMASFYWQHSTTLNIIQLFFYLLSDLMMSPLWRFSIERWTRPWIDQIPRNPTCSQKWFTGTTHVKLPLQWRHNTTFLNYKTNHFVL